MKDKDIHKENSKDYQKIKALKALAIAKELEHKQLKGGKAYHRLDNKTHVLR